MRVLRANAVAGFTPSKLQTAKDVDAWARIAPTALVNLAVRIRPESFVGQCGRTPGPRRMTAELSGSWSRRAPEGEFRVMGLSRPGSAGVRPHLRFICRCSTEGMRQTSSADRDGALRRLRRTTSVVLVAAGALVAAFAGLAARALPGHHTVKTTSVGVRATSRRATPPPLVAVQSTGTPAAPAAPGSPPVQTQAPPVAVSGGT
jgi:hypothetical protein